MLYVVFAHFFLCMTDRQNSQALDLVGFSVLVILKKK
jgi:hypothetical protein